MAKSRRIDLKLRLALRVVAVSAFGFTTAATYALVESDRTAEARAGRIAELVARTLELEQDRHDWIKMPSRGFPDLQDIVVPFMAPGLCIAYRARSGEILQRICSGPEPRETAIPDYFAALYRSAFGPGREIARPVHARTAEPGEAVVSVDPASRIGQAWDETGRLLAIMAVTLTGLCILVYAALARALRPTRVIVSGLERLAAGDLTTRLPEFDLAELSDIRGVFNQLAESLDRTLAERNALTRRLIAVQDEERQALARELHDEFGQCLTAIGALAASAGQTAREEYPALLPECQSVARITAQMMETLRGALVRLRPPDIDELGLAGSLESLMAGWNGRYRGRTRFDIDLCGGFDAVPPDFAAGLYRIAQEAVTNAAKHAEATRVKLRLRWREASKTPPDRQGPEIELTVEDDGKAGALDIRDKSGMGLLGMRERVAALGGRLSLEAGCPAGLILCAVIPVPPLANGVPRTKG
jgi:signal transduction histidine kinase